MENFWVWFWKIFQIKDECNVKKSDHQYVLTGKKYYVNRHFLFYLVFLPLFLVSIHKFMIPLSSVFTFLFLFSLWHKDMSVHILFDRCHLLSHRNTSRWIQKCRKIPYKTDSCYTPGSFLYQHHVQYALSNFFFFILK